MVDIGRAVVGASAVGAVVLAIGLGIVTAPGKTLSVTPGRGIACGSYPDGTTTAAAWFMVEFENPTGRSVHVADVGPVSVEGADVTPLQVVVHDDGTPAGLWVTDAPVMPHEFGRTVAIGAGWTVPAHGRLDLVGRLVVHPGASVGRVDGFTATSAGPLWTTHTATLDQSFAIGVGDGNSGPAIGCGSSFLTDDA